MLLTKHERRARFWRNFLIFQLIVVGAIWKVIPELFELSGHWQIIVGALTIFGYIWNRRKALNEQPIPEKAENKLYHMEWHSPQGIQYFQFYGPAIVEATTCKFSDLNTGAETIVTGSFKIMVVEN